MAEFAINNNESATTKPFPFFAIKSLYFYISFNKVKFFNASIYKQIPN